MLVSICVIAYNEEQFLPSLLNYIKAQDYPHKDIELILTDNKSTDTTKKIMTEFALKNEAEKDFKSVWVIDSPKNLQAVAWNEALLNAAGDIIIRLDAHSVIPSGFVSANVRNIQSGEYVCGGGRPNKTYKKTSWAYTMLAAEECMFGGTACNYRKVQKEKKYINTVFHGAYRKEVFAKVGGFNEDLGRTEDNELHYRITKAGYKICCCPDILSYQYIRETFCGMLKQKFQNGKWIGLTLGICPRCLSMFYFAPLALVLGYLLFALLAVFGIWLPLVLLTTVYLLFDLFITASAFLNRKVYTAFLLLPFMFPLLHISYGAGTLAGICKMPFWRKTLDGSSTRRIELVKKSFLNKNK